MRGGIVAAHNLVHAARDNLAILDDDRPERAASILQIRVSELDGLAKEMLAIAMASLSCPAPIITGTRRNCTRSAFAHELRA